MPPAEARVPLPPSVQIGLTIARAAADGQRRMTVRLDPPELGRVEVRLDFAADGALKAMIRAERPEAIHLLQRDAHLLERALADSGFKTDSASLNFSLNQNGQGQGQGHGQGPAGHLDDAAANGDGAGEQSDPQASELATLSEDGESPDGSLRMVLDGASGINLVI